MINYQNIQDSITYYNNKGYKRVETPWTVTEAISKLTKPEDKIDWKISNKNKALVGSAEQGFLYLVLKGFLPNGKYQSTSPCFREEIFDLIHSKYFLKNEIFITEEVNDITLHLLINDALWFFAQKLKVSDEDYNKGEIIKIVEISKDTYDIEYKGVELGSYGIRENNLCRYIYGTACAEPRLSYCQKLKL